MNAEQHRSYSKWLKELDFYESEIRIFEKELDMLVEKHPALLSIIEHVEEYQRILAKKNKRILSLRNQIKFKDQSFTSEGNLEEEKAWSFVEIEKEREGFVNKIETLKKSFRRFVAKNMH